MKRWIIACALALTAGLALVIVSRRYAPLPRIPPAPPIPSRRNTAPFELTSSAFSNGGAIPTVHTCDGGDVRPPLLISGVPPATESLAVVMYDPDAPGGTFVHWIAWNISPDTTALGTPLPAGAVEGTNSFRTIGYRGPCPPGGTHRYIWRLYALRTIVTLGSDATLADLEKAINTFVITQTELMGTYSRP